MFRKNDLTTEENYKISLSWQKKSVCCYFFYEPYQVQFDSWSFIPGFSLSLFSRTLIFSSFSFSSFMGLVHDYITNLFVFSQKPSVHLYQAKYRNNDLIIYEEFSVLVLNSIRIKMSPFSRSRYRSMESSYYFLRYFPNS